MGKFGRSAARRGESMKLNKKMKKINYILAIFFLFTSCNFFNNSTETVQTTQKDQISQPISEEKPPFQEELTTLQTIRKIIDMVGFVELPYKIYYDQDGVDVRNEDIYILQRKIGVQAGCFYGILPDTTHFFGVLYFVAASIAYPNLATFDKEGILIDKQSIVGDNCYEMAGASVFCDEYTIINKDLTMHYHYKSKHIFDGGNYGAVLVCKHIERDGRIEKNGKIIAGENREIPVEDCEEDEITKKLMKEFQED
jgi:hypothetical protein